MSERRFWRHGAIPAAAGALGALMAQAVMALFLLRLFEPAAVGTFSVVAQVAFGWAMLALAQSPVSLLANQHLPPLAAARQAWRLSLQRWLWLGPVAVLAIGWSSTTARGPNADIGIFNGTDWGITLWAAAIALAQLSWLLAQSLALRTQSPSSIAAVRALPPWLAVAWAGLAALCWARQDSQTLLAAALAGYVAGAMWLLPLLRSGLAEGQRIQAPQTAASHDPRSDRLKFLHTLSDVLVAGALATHWARVYGAAEAGCLLILLRVLGFVPALASTAWAQVVLSRPRERRPSSVLAALVAVLGLVALALLLLMAVRLQWLAPVWQGLLPYVWPLVLWQIAASLTAVVSHRPFRFGKAHAYTWQCLGINAGQALLVLAPPWWGWSLHTHLWALSLWLSVMLGLQALWAARLRA